MVPMSMVVAVSGSVGGIGASTFAWALAQQLTLADGEAQHVCLIDVQPDGAPLDLIVGCEQTPGIRWSQVRIRSTDIAANVILQALPAHHGVAVLSADSGATADPVALGHLVAALRRDGCRVVLDIGARDAVLPTLQPDVEVLLLPPTLPGIVAAHAVLRRGAELIVVDTGNADVTPEMVATQLGRAPRASIRWQRSVRDAAVSAAPFPATSDVMRAAAEVLVVVNGA